MNPTFKNTVIRKLFRSAGFGLVLAAAQSLCPAQVAANLLPTISPSGEYVRTPNEGVKVVEVSEAGMTLECTQESMDGLEPSTWRERYSIRGGRLVLDSVFTLQMVPPQPAHAEWQMAAAIGTTNVGPATFDPRWNNYKSYLQYVIESVQSEWAREVAANRIQSTSGSVVTVKFQMNSEGQIVQILGVHETGQAPASATVPCIRAINGRAPYGNWTDAMVAALGNEQVMTFSFYYQ